MFNVPPTSAIQKFQVLYEKHYGIMLSEKEAEVKLTALLGLLSVARECAAASGAAHERGEEVQECNAMERTVCRSNGTPTEFPKTNEK